MYHAACTALSVDMLTVLRNPAPVVIDIALLQLIYYGISRKVKSQNNILNIMSVLRAVQSGVQYPAVGKRYLLFKNPRPSWGSTSHLFKGVRSSCLGGKAAGV